MGFTLQAYFNPHLPKGASRLDAVLTVTCDPGDGGQAAVAGPRFVAIVLDCSGSMFNVADKIVQAKHAARRCIASLPENAIFTVVAFGDAAKVVIPACAATESNRALAERAVQALGNMGGTCMSRALHAVRAEAARLKPPIAWAYLLTDGRNSGERHAELEREVNACKGVFQCDCRGVGEDWEPEELRFISNALLGTADAVPDPGDLQADFSRALGQALSKGVGGVGLEFWKPASSRLVSLRQMQPENVDITALGAAKTDRVTAFGIGAWGRETRDYHAVFELQPGEIGDEMLVCRPSVVWTSDGVDQKAQAQAPIVAAWSEDADLTARISPEVAHYTGQAELAASIQEGLAARDRGNVVEATRLLGRAAQLARTSGNEEVTRRLSKVVEVVDAAVGTVRLRANVSKGETLELEMGGARTVRRGAGHG